MSAATFSGPHNLDDSRNISQWVQYTTDRSPAHPFFAYASSSSDQHVLTGSNIGAAVERAAYHVESYLNLATSADEEEATPPVIGILANLDSVTYFTVFLGILRAGGTAFLISNRNSPAAVSHLLKKTRTSQLFVSTDEAIQTLVSTALALDKLPVTVYTAPTYQALFENEDHVFPQSKGLKTSIDAPAVILHSSGSTSFPKPLVWTQHTLLEFGQRFALVSEPDLSQDRLAFHAMPPYHAMGCIMLFWALRTGLTLAVFPPQSPPVVPSPASFLNAAVASQSTYLVCVPIFLEIWSHDPAAITHLTKLKAVGFSGGPLSRKIGDELSRRGLPLIQFYGTTESGSGGFGTRSTPLRPSLLPTPSLHNMTMFHPPDPKEWEWLKITPLEDARFLPQEGTDTFELVFVQCVTHRPVVLNCTIEGKAAFATNDIVIKHPTDTSRFKLQGRKDDQIMLSSGEKTNPGPIERTICTSPLVKSAVMFGRGRDQNGIIIQPAKELEFDPQDTTQLSRFRNEIWTSVMEANESAPAHSRLFKEMILVTFPSRPIEMTPKLTPRRASTLEAYKEEIDAIYDAVKTSTKLDIPLPQVWNYGEVLNYVRHVVHDVVRKQVADNADIFEHGGDSLQATYIRNSFVFALRQARKSGARQVSQNFVYENATIVKLASRLYGIINDDTGSTDDDIVRKLQEMEAMVSDCSAHFPEHHWQSQTRQMSVGEVVLLTGTTAGLGSQLLAYLASSADVSHVYALNRHSYNKSLRDRQADALTQRGLDSGIIDSPKVTIVEGDTAIGDFDISPLLYQEIRDSITLIIHNAWMVNFNLGFESFERNIRGVRNLVDLALTSPRRDPPRILYASSVSVFKNWNSEQGRPLEASIEDPKLVLGSGYGESKYIAERILENAAQFTPLRPIIVRIGQMTSTSNGAWNSRDWLPAIVRSGQVLGVLPARDDCIAWVSLETAAQAIFEFRNSGSQYLHLAHPNPSSWNSVFDVFSARLNVPLISWREWLAKLEMYKGDAEKNPALYLLEFFRGCAPMVLKNLEAPGITLMDLTQALRSSRSLAQPSLPQIGAEDAERWLKYWETVGYLSKDF